MLRKLNYRPDIDGLRALAVLSVILFHINPNYMPSGFLGVDIFFVISGYLITSIIYREMVEGTFSFANFYNRRIKRILPVFFVVLFVGLIVVWSIFLPRDFYGIINSVIASLAFMSNIYFARLGDYFGIDNELRPFTHIWSLSVEEQFYFIFPLILLIIFKIKFFSKNKLITLVVGGCILILLSFINLKKFDIELDIYYLPHLRIIELFIGSILSVFLYEKGNKLSVKQSNILGVISFIVLFLSLYIKDFFTPDNYFPGVLALLPCTATGLLILSNEKGQWIKDIFSLKFVVWIGKLSYSLYLWHWVVLAIFRYIFGVGVLSLNNLLVALAITFIFSLLTYYLIEQPFRKKKYSFKKSLLLFYILPTIVLLSICFVMRTTKIPEDQQIFKHYNPKECDKCLQGDNVTALGDLHSSSSSKKILVIGDSHTSHIAPFIDIVAKKQGIKINIISEAGCPFLFDSSYPSIKKGCRQMNEYMRKHYQEYDIFILSNSIVEDEDILDFRRRLIETIQKLLDENKKVYLLNSSLIFDYNLPQVMYIEKNLSIKQNLKLKGENYNKAFKQWEQIKGLVKNKFPKVEIIDLLEYINEEGTIDGRPIILDRTHLNVYGAKKIAEKFIEEGKVLIKKEDL